MLCPRREGASSRSGPASAAARLPSSITVGRGTRGVAASSAGNCRPTARGVATLPVLPHLLRLGGVGRRALE